MIVTGAFTGPIEGESPMGTVKRFSSAKADTEMSVTNMMKMSFLKEYSPLAISHHAAIREMRLSVDSPW
jgi:hypothetical protein